MYDEETFKREVQRQVAIASRPHLETIEDLKNANKELQKEILMKNLLLDQSTVVFGFVCQINMEIDRSLFTPKKLFKVVNSGSSFYNKTGCIISCELDSEIATCDMNDGVIQQFNFSEIELLGGNGRKCVILSGGKFFQAHYLVSHEIVVGDYVSVLADNKAIIRKEQFDIYNASRGIVESVDGHLVTVSCKNDLYVIYNFKNLELSLGDTILMDRDCSVVFEKIDSDDSKKYLVGLESKISWDSIGGLKDAKEDLINAIELPVKYPELFSHYQMNECQGVLLYGPPGCGKTLLARAAATSISKTYDYKGWESAYLYVKGPEILNKWVGNSEAEIRSIFKRCRKHYQKYGYKAILAIDEAESIFPQRGAATSSDVYSTIVTMFLGEMSGFSEEDSKANPLVMLLTNRSDIIDPALVRDGRINLKIKINRPTKETAGSIFDLYTKSLPFVNPKNREAILAMTISALFSDSKLIYKVNGEHNFTLADCVNGAMIENIVQMAKLNALLRDSKEGMLKGLVFEDFEVAVGKIYQQQKGANHVYDLHDFADRNDLSRENLKVTRVFSSK